MGHVASTYPFTGLPNSSSSATDGSMPALFFSLESLTAPVCAYGTCHVPYWRYLGGVTRDA